MESNKKILLSTVFIAILIVLVTGITFAFFNYTRTGVANNISVGRIYFNTSQNGIINLTNVFPIASSEATGENDNYDSIEITITGDTTYEEGVEYLVTAVDVNNTITSGSTEKVIPITIEVEASNGLGTEDDNYFNNQGGLTSKYKLLTNGKVKDNGEILVGYIASGQTGINGTLTIKAYLDASNIAISDTYPSGDVTHIETSGETSNEVLDYTNGTTSDWVGDRTVLTTEEWNSFQGNNALSFKIRVEANEGIWVDEPEPDNVTPASCFETRLIDVYTLNTNMTQTELNACIDYFDNINYEYQDVDFATSEDFCLGTGKRITQTLQTVMDDDYETNGALDYNYLESHNIVTKEQGLSIINYDSSCGTDIVIPNKMNFTTLLHNDNMIEEEIDDCVNFFTNYGATADNGSSLEDYCRGTGTIDGRTFEEHIKKNEYFIINYLDYLKEHNFIIEGEIKKYPVLVLGWDRKIIQRDFPITNIVLNKSLRIINSEAFSGVDFTNINSITIPFNVRSIFIKSFAVNNYSPNHFIPMYILGKPSISGYPIDSSFMVTYGGTCDELYANSDLTSYQTYPYIIYGESNAEYNVITTDTNTCKVYAGNDW